MNQTTVEGVLRPGWYLYWQSRRYRMLSFDTAALVVQVEAVETGEQSSFQLAHLLLETSTKLAPLFAPTLALLDALIARQRPTPAVTPTDDLPMTLLARADRIIQVIQQVDAQMRAVVRQTQDRSYTAVLRQMLAQLDDPVSLATYYRYRDCYQQAQGDRGRIAASLRRESYNQTRLNTAQQHFVDTLILRFYARQPPIRPSTLYKLAQKGFVFTHIRRTLNLAVWY